VSERPPKKQGGSGEHPAVKLYNEKIGEAGGHLTDLHTLNERLRRLTVPPNERPTEPAPPPGSAEPAPVVQVPQSSPTPSGPPAPESKR